ncbi:hypothetical protein SLS61_010248 [Didymella pomorum]
MVDYRYGMQSDAFAAENDFIPRGGDKRDQKPSLSNSFPGDDGAPNDADDLLAAMGYKPELVRSRSTLQVAFMCFVLASIPYGLATTLYYPIVGGGPTTIIWGWLAVSCIILCVAVSLGEITSVYPTSGGVYYQTFMLAPPSYRRIASWICGWSFVVGNITITLSVNFATALFFVASINVFESSPGIGILAGKPYQVYLIFLGITLICNCVSAFGNKWLPWLDVEHPATQVPKAMVGTILLNTICGLVFLIPLVFVMPDQAMLVGLLSGQPTPVIIRDAVGSPGAAFGLLIPLIILGFFCGIGTTTATSRATWAFARDGAIPGFKWWKTVNPKLDVPLNAMMLSMVVQLALGLIYFGAVTAFNAFSGVGVICLTVSYACPILVSLIQGRTQVKDGNFYLGTLGTFCNVVALAWSALATPLFSMPTSIPVTPRTMNYASVVFAAFFAIATAWYFVWGKKNYKGPPTHEAIVLEARRASMVNTRSK